MDTTRLCEILDEVANLGVLDVTLAGGEPFLHPQFFEILEHAVNTGMPVGVLTNGTLLDQRRVKRLESIVSGKSCTIQISLDSLDPVVNDRTRGQGQRIIDNLENLDDCNLNLQMSTVVNNYNCKTAHLIIDRMYPKVKSFHFLLTQKTSKALENPDVFLAMGQAEEFWLRLWEHSKKFPTDLKLPSLRSWLKDNQKFDYGEKIAFAEKATFSCNSCTAGITNINVKTNLDVVGCDIAKDYTRMGNLASDTFEEVFNSKLAHAVRSSKEPLCYKIKPNALDVYNIK